MKFTPSKSQEAGTARVAAGCLRAALSDGVTEVTAHSLTPALAGASLESHTDPLTLESLMTAPFFTTDEMLQMSDAYEAAYAAMTGDETDDVWFLADPYTIELRIEHWEQPRSTVTVTRTALEYTIVVDGVTYATVTTALPIGYVAQIVFTITAHTEA